MKSQRRWRWQQTTSARLAGRPTREARAGPGLVIDTAVPQSDDGTLLATAGGDLTRLDRYGDVLSSIKTPVSDAANGVGQFYGSYNADVSPDGKTAAYGYVHSGWTTDSQGYTNFEQRNGAGFTHSDALTGFTDAGYKYS